MEILLAQHAGRDDGGSFAITMIALVVAWIFWKAKKRDEAEERRRDPWRNVPSS